MSNEIRKEILEMSVRPGILEKVNSLPFIEEIAIPEKNLRDYCLEDVMETTEEEFEKLKGNILRRINSDNPQWFIKPMVLSPLPNQNFQIICGHKRRLVLRELGFKMIPKERNCYKIVDGLTEEQKRELFLADNYSIGKIRPWELAKLFAEDRAKGKTIEEIADDYERKIGLVSGYLKALELTKGFSTVENYISPGNVLRLTRGLFDPESVLKGILQRGEKINTRRVEELNKKYLLEEGQTIQKVKVETKEIRYTSSESERPHSYFEPRKPNTFKEKVKKELEELRKLNPTFRKVSQRGGGIQIINGNSEPLKDDPSMEKWTLWIKLTGVEKRKEVK